MTTSVLKRSSPGGSPFYETQTATATDTASVAQSNPNFCGSYQYSISSASTAPATVLSATELTIDAVTGLISLYTANSASVGTHIATITAKLANYPLIPQVTATLQITIQACLVTSYTMLALSPGFDKSYTIANPALIWSIPFSSIQTTQVPACGHSETLTSTATASLITPTVLGTGIDYFAKSDNLLDAGVHTVTVTSTITNYPSIFCQSTFILTAIDPCLTTSISISPAIIESLVAFAGYTVKSKNLYTFNDAASVSSSLSPDLGCEKQLTFNLNGTETSFISGNNADFFYFNPPSTSKDFGVGHATVQAILKNNPTIKSPIINFSVFILGPLVRVLDYQIYQLNSKALSIPYKPFEFIPNFLNVGPRSQSVYVLTGAPLPEKFDFSCNCFTELEKLDWITFDDSTNTLKVETSNSFDIGVHKVIVVEELDQFDGIYPYTSFDIVIQPGLESALQISSECPRKNVTFWSFDLPRKIDQLDLLVNMTFANGSTFFSHDTFEIAFKQQRIFQRPINETLLKTPKNQLSLNSTYSVDVQFGCNFSNSQSLTNRSKNESKIEARQWPKVKISRIELYGLLHIKLQKPQRQSQQRQLAQNDSADPENRFLSTLFFEFVPGNPNDYDKQKVNFNWTYVDLTHNELLIQLDFENLNYISSNQVNPDSIKMSIFGIQIFEDSLQDVISEPSELDMRTLPPLATRDEVLTAQTLLKATKNTVGTTVLMMLISGPIQQILSVSRHTQIILHLVLIEVSFPAPALIFFGGLLDMANFQLIDLTNFYNRVFQLDPDSMGNSPFNNRFELMGYSSLYMVQNFGMFFLTIFLPFIARIVSAVAVWISQGRCYKRNLQSYSQQTSEQLQYGFWISFFDESYLFLIVCSGVNIQLYFEWQQGGDAFNSILALIFGVLLITFPLFVAIFYTRNINYDRIWRGDLDFKARFGSIIDGLYLKRQQKLALIYPYASLLRKLLLAYLFVFQNKKPLLNIFCVMVSSLLMITVTGIVEPMILRSENRMQLFNEVFVLLFLYPLFLLTNYLSDLDARKLVGWSLVAVTLFNLAVNLLFRSSQNLFRFLKKLQLLYRQHKYRRHQRIAQQKQQLEWRNHAEEQRQEIAEPEAIKPQEALGDENIVVSEEISQKAAENQKQNQIKSRQRKPQLHKHDAKTNAQSQSNSSLLSISLKEEEFVVQDQSKIPQKNKTNAVPHKIEVNKSQKLSKLSQVQPDSKDYVVQEIVPAQSYQLQLSMSPQEKQSGIIDQKNKEMKLILDELAKISVFKSSKVQSLLPQTNKLSSVQQITQQQPPHFIKQQQKIVSQLIPQQLTKLAYVDFLIYLQRYSEPSDGDLQLSLEVLLKCKQIVQDNKFGIDLRPVGRIQGPFEATNCFQTKREVIFIFDHIIRAKDLWDGTTQNQLAQEAVNIRAVSEFHVQNHLGHTYVNLKQKKKFLKDSDARNKRNKEKFEQLVLNQGVRPAFLERDDSLERLNEQFPGLVSQIMLFEFTSEFRRTQMQVYALKVDVELLRFGILVNGQDLHRKISTNGLTSDALEKMLIEITITATRLTRDFPKRVYQDIISGRFAERMQRYQRQRNDRTGPQGLRDYGEVSTETKFEKLVDMYELIIRHDDQRYRIQ